MPEPEKKLLTKPGSYSILLLAPDNGMHEWLSGGAPPCQGGGRGFESRLVLAETNRNSGTVRVSVFYCESLGGRRRQEWKRAGATIFYVPAAHTGFPVSEKYPCDFLPDWCYNTFYLYPPSCSISLTCRRAGSENQGRNHQWRVQVRDRRQKEPLRRRGRGRRRRKVQQRKARQISVRRRKAAQRAERAAVRQTAAAGRQSRFNWKVLSARRF